VNENPVPIASRPCAVLFRRRLAIMRNLADRIRRKCRHVASAQACYIRFRAGGFQCRSFACGRELDDSEQLKSVTNEARRLIAQSGRYTLVDISSADAPAVKEHRLRKCDGCEAAIALKLGAGQSLIGIVTRISRIEYTVRFQIRDAQTGAVISNKQTDLRMGANYSWSRGAAWLIKNRLLDSQDQP